MKALVLTLMMMVISSASFAGEKKLYNCADNDSGEQVVTAIAKDYSVTFSFQRSGKTEKSTTDLMSATKTLTMVSGQLDHDGEALVAEYCPKANPRFTTILNVDDKIQKRFCLSCMEMNTQGGVR